MARLLYDGLALVDSSAIIALEDPTDQFHRQACEFRDGTELAWVALNVTSHEAFTRIRYKSLLADAVSAYDALRKMCAETIDFTPDDEHGARQLLLKYTDQTLSFHDALCAAVMKRIGVYKVFTFDSDFWTFGFEVMPGATM